MATSQQLTAEAPSPFLLIRAPQRRTLAVGLVLTVTAVAAEALAVATILPIVAAELGGLALYGWAFSAFFLGDLVGIVVTGMAVDRRGLVLPYLAGLTLFGIGLLVGGLAPSMAMLVGGRLVQGLGAGAIPTVAYVAIGRGFPDSARPLMFAFLSTAWVVPGLLGPGLASVVAATIGWRWVFLGLLPLLVLAGLLTVPALRRLAPSEAAAALAARATDRAADLRRLGAVLLTAGGAALLLAGLSSASLLGAALIAAGLLAGLPALHRLVPPGTLRGRPGLPATILLRGVQTFAFFGAEAYLPLAIVAIRHEPAVLAGLALTAATLAWTAGSWIQARLVGRQGPRRLLGAGLLCVTGGIALTALVLSPSVPVAVTVVSWSLTGLGMGLSYSVISLVVLREAPAGQQGRLTSSMQLADVLGTALGAGLGGALVAVGLAQGWDPALGLAIAFAVSTGAASGGVVLTRRVG
jgi:MFS family permease